MMFRFMHKETGKYLVSSNRTVPRPYPCNEYRFTWSKSGHYYRGAEAIKRTIKRLESEGIPYELIQYDEQTLFSSRVISKDAVSK